MTEKAEAAEHVKTAKIERAEIRKTTGKLSDRADRTTELAADRTLFAAERTYAAWVRTGLAALVSGVGAKALLTGVLTMLVVKISGTILILFSAFCFGAAIWREISPGLPPPFPDARKIPGPILYFVNAFLALVALMAAVSMWIK